MVRRAREEDLGRVLEIEEEAFPTPRSISSFRYDLRRDCFLVYEREGEVAGYVIVDVESAPPWLSVLEGETYGHVLDLAVADEYRREGIGEELLHRALNYLRERGIDRVKLEVRVGNDPAMNLYEKVGFERDRVLEGYYADGDDAWLMLRDL